MSKIYEMAFEFKDRHPGTISFRTKKHCKILEKHLNSDEEPYYAFVAQKNDSQFDIFMSCVVLLTNKRILIGQKRLIFGYMFTSITPDMFNDLKIKMGVIWGRVYIDTLKEKIKLSNISRKALPEIETRITEYMMKEKKKYSFKSS